MNDTSPEKPEDQTSRLSVGDPRSARAQLSGNLHQGR